MATIKNESLFVGTELKLNINIEPIGEVTMEDPIPYTPPQQIFEGKYYTQYNVLYKCTRDSGIALSHDLYDIRGLYVELVD